MPHNETRPQAGALFMFNRRRNGIKTAWWWPLQGGFAFTSKEALALDLRRDRALAGNR
jgi:hypothetical protein